MKSVGLQPAMLHIFKAHKQFRILPFAEYADRTKRPHKPLSVEPLLTMNNQSV
jgi:hypothetical protein